MDECKPLSPGKTIVLEVDSSDTILDVKAVGSLRTSVQALDPLSEHDPS